MALQRVQAREHRERAQPAARQKLGLLEKKKDYVLRAKDFHRKERRMKGLRQRAALKNPDEFYFGMIRAQTSKGVHSVSSKPQLPGDVLKLLKTQDLHYVSMLKRMNECKMDRLRAVLPQSLADGAARPEHLVFAEDDDERRAILATAEAGVVGAGASGSESGDDAPVQQAAEPAALREYKVRQQRVETLALAERKLQTQRHVMQPGRRRVVGTDEWEQPVFKWKAQRKK